MGDWDFIKQSKAQVYSLLDWFVGYENSDGLLEKVPSWVFVKWSTANDFVQDINFPSNMLYARMLEATAHLFDDSRLYDKAQELKQCIRQRSFNGDFFVDNEVYDAAGRPVFVDERTETCQYYAFFTGVATPANYPALWKRLVTEFGPDREKENRYPRFMLPMLSLVTICA